MASIDKIRVNGASYNINLPTTATPSIASLTVSGGATITGELSTAGDTTLSKNLTVGRDTTISGSLSAATATVSQYLSVGESAAVSKNLTVGGSTTISGGYHKGYIRIYPTTPEYSPSILFHDDQNKLTTTLTQDLQNECFEVTAFGGSLILSAGLGHGIYFKEGANT